MLGVLKRGDRVVTGGGMLATVIRVSPESDEVIVEISKNPQVRVTVAKGTIASVMREEGEAKPAEEGEAKPQAKRGKKERAEAEAPAAAPPAPEAPAEPTPANDQPPPRQG